MKRIYMALVALLVATTGAFAQRNANLEVKITAPDSLTHNNNIPTGTAVTFSITVTNNGPDSIQPTDTIRIPMYGFCKGATSGGSYIYPYATHATNGIAVGSSASVSITAFTQGLHVGNGQNGEAVNVFYPTNDTAFYYFGIYGQEADGTLFTDSTLNADSLAAYDAGTATFEGTFLSTASHNFGYNWTIFGTPGTETGVGNIAGLPKESLNVYPNPVTAGSALNIKYAFTTATNASIRVTDISGRTLITKNLGKQGIGEKTFDLNLNSLASGNYFVELVTESKRAIAQVVLNK